MQRSTTAEPHTGNGDAAARAKLTWPLLIAFALAGLALNGYWYWRDARTTVSLGTVAEWIRENKLARAEHALRAHLRRHPHDAEARVLLARALAAGHDTAGCARELLKVPYWSPFRPEALLRAGESLLATNRAREAEEALKAVIEPDAHHVAPPVFQEACKNLFDLYITEGRRDEAQALLWRAFDTAAAPDRLALLEMWTRREVEPLPQTDPRPALRRYIAADKDDMQALLGLACAELAHGEPNKGREYAKAYLKANPDDLAAWRTYLATLCKSDDRSAFFAAATQLPKSVQSDPTALRFRGLANEEQRKWPEALQCYRDALRFDPFSAECYERLAQVEERVGETRDANEHRQRGEKLRTAKTVLRDTLAAYRDGGARQLKPNRPELAATIQLIADACDTLGLTRMAVAWTEQLSKARAATRE